MSHPLVTSNRKMPHPGYRKVSKCPTKCPGDEIDGTINGVVCYPQVATDAYGDFATSVQSINKPRSDVNLIESTQAIEEFAFKYASFNLNASKTEERKKNNHIGKALITQNY